MSEKKRTCEDRIDYELEKELETLKELWEGYLSGDDDKTTEFYEYGLSFSYTVPDDEREPFFCFQISWGGPSDEFRFFVRPDLKPYRIEYHFQDWFDGAKRVLEGEAKELLKEIYIMSFVDSGSAEYEYQKELEY
jgi:hypothetical protein